MPAAESFGGSGHGLDDTDSDDPLAHTALSIALQHAGHIPQQKQQRRAPVCWNGKPSFGLARKRAVRSDSPGACGAAAEAF